jgi:hypothetical protein
VNKAKVIAKLELDGATIEEGTDSYGDKRFEAWLPNNLIWDCKHRVGSVCVIKSPSETMASFWASVWSEIDGPVIEEAK